MNSRSSITIRLRSIRPLWFSAMLIAGAAIVLAFIAAASVSGRSAGATVASATPPVYMNAYLANRPIEPTQFAPTDPKMYVCIKQMTNYIAAIKWSSWGGAIAEGTGMAGVDCRGWDGNRERSAVKIVLSGKQECAGLATYGSYTLQLVSGSQAPPLWNAARSGRFPCNPGIPGCNPEVWGKSHLSTGPFECGPLGLRIPAGPKRVFAKWKPRTPPGELKQLRRILGAKWQRWAQAKTTGVGAMLDQHGHTDLLWPAKIELSRPIYCPSIGDLQAIGDFGSTISYSKLKLTLYGSGVKEKGHKPNSYYDRLIKTTTAMVGKDGLKEHLFTQRIGHGSAKLCSN